jgi:hypothetical protein
VVVVVDATHTLAARQNDRTFCRRVDTMSACVGRKSLQDNGVTMVRALPWHCEVHLLTPPRSRLNDA